MASTVDDKYVTISRVLGLFIIAAFSFIVALSWNNFIELVFNKIKVIDDETGDQVALIWQALIFSIIITGIAILLIYFLYIFGYVESDKL